MVWVIDWMSHCLLSIRTRQRHGLVLKDKARLPRLYFTQFALPSWMIRKMQCSEMSNWSLFTLCIYNKSMTFPHSKSQPRSPKYNNFWPNIQSKKPNNTVHWSGEWGCSDLQLSPYDYKTNQCMELIWNHSQICILSKPKSCITELISYWNETW